MLRVSHAIYVFSSADDTVWQDCTATFFQGIERHLLLPVSLRPCVPATLRPCSGQGTRPHHTTPQQRRGYHRLSSHSLPPELTLAGPVQQLPDASLDVWPAAKSEMASAQVYLCIWPWRSQLRCEPLGHVHPLAPVAPVMSCKGRSAARY